MILEMNGHRFMVGKWQAIVVSDVDNNTIDGVKIVRGVRVRVYGLHDDDTPSRDLPIAKCCLPRTGVGSGEKPRPNVGQVIYVSFEQGNPDFPIWEGGTLEDQDAPSGHSIQRIDGNDQLTVTKDQTVTVGQSQAITIQKNQALTVGQKATLQFQELEKIVIGGQTVTIGRRQLTIKGNDQTEVQGDLVWSIVGNQNINVGGDQSESVVGSWKKVALAQAIIKALNVGGLPTSSALLLEAINGGVQAVAKSIVGVEGASLWLDPVGATSALKSLASLSIESPVIRLGPTGQATVPVCTLPHTHLVFGIPTATATPGPGTPISILGPAL